MKLTPLDIRKHEFDRKLRGYDPVEVKAFTEMVSQQWDEVLEELRHAQDRIRELEAKISHYEKVEEALQEALEAAREGARRTQQHAEERAHLIIEEAELKAEQLVQEAEQERMRLRQDVSKLTHRHQEVTARLRHFLMSELEILARHEEDRPIGFMKLMPVKEAEALPPAPETPIEPEEEDLGQERPRSEQERAAAQRRRARAAEAREVERGARPAARTEPKAEPQEPAWGREEADDEAEDTTYAELYARAAQRDRDREQEQRHRIEEVEDEDFEEPTWTLRSIVTGTSEEDEEAVASPSEKERIRRILEDLD